MSALPGFDPLFFFYFLAEIIKNNVAHVKHARSYYPQLGKLKKKKKKIKISIVV
jgi:hypothetical protein